MNTQLNQAPSAVVFDLGEVLATPRDLFARLSRAASAPQNDLEKAYWDFRDDHDRGGSAPSFWTSVLSAVDISPNIELISELTALDASAWVTIRPDAMEAFKLLKNHTTTVAILSNAPVELAVEARLQEWAQFVDKWFFSGELGVAKPDSRIYDIVAESLSVPPSQILFFDDRQANVNAAARAGWNAKLWTSGAETTRVLSSMTLI